MAEGDASGGFAAMVGVVGGLVVGVMWKASEKWRRVCFSLSAFQSFSLLFYECDENGDELVAFVFYGGESPGAEYAVGFEAFEPVKGFVRFAQGVTQLCPVFGGAASALGFAVVRANRIGRAHELLPVNVRKATEFVRRAFGWQREIELGDASAKQKSAFAKVSLFVKHGERKRLKD
jgi:hypothetical protein